MKNFIQHGDTITIESTPAGGVKSGDFFCTALLCGIAVYDAQEGAPSEMVREGVFELKKANPAALWEQGRRVYWTPSRHRLDLEGDVVVGVVAATSLAGNATARVLLDGAIR